MTDRRQSPRNGGPRQPDPWPVLAGQLVGLLAEVAGSAPAAEHDPRFCRVCPLCRAVTQLRQVRPDLADQVTAAAAGIAVALQALVRPLVPAGPDWPALRTGPPTGSATGPATGPGPEAQQPERPDPDPEPVWPWTVRPPIEKIDNAD